MTPFEVLDTPLIPGDAVAALITLDDGRYLMQLRDSKQGIFYPGHWGLFGGAVDANEDHHDALCRELMEELQLQVDHARYFTAFEFDFSFSGQGKLLRVFYEVPLKVVDLPKLILGEGSKMRAFSVEGILGEKRVVPYDAFAIWMHRNQLFFHEI